MHLASGRLLWSLVTCLTTSRLVHGQQPVNSRVDSSPPLEDRHVPAGPDTASVVGSTVLDRIPRIVACGGPLAYPAGLRKAHITGRVLLDVVIGPDGSPERQNVWVEESTNSGFNKAALAFLRSCRFTPPHETWYQSADASLCTD